MRDDGRGIQFFHCLFTEKAPKRCTCPPLEVPAVAVAVEESQPHFIPDFQGLPPVPPPVGPNLTPRTHTVDAAFILFTLARGVPQHDDDDAPGLVESSLLAFTIRAKDSKNASRCSSSPSGECQIQYWLQRCLTLQDGVAYQVSPHRTFHSNRDTDASPRIPLNDDVHEKGQRMSSRRALQERQFNEIKKAATPRKVSLRRDDMENSPGADPRTPHGSRSINIDDDEGFVVGGTAVTPMKRVPILANFEEWMKMATDNKINATNSWNFALIDYFHDMSLLKEGDGVNFQKASCTLDGCVKIYTNRVDSVATETGKLLSGLADSNNAKKKDRDGEEGEESDEEELDENGNVKKKPKKKVMRRSWRSQWLMLTFHRHNDHPKLPWPPLSTHYSSRNLSLNLLLTPYSRRRLPTLTRVVPRDFC